MVHFDVDIHPASPWDVGNEVGRNSLVGRMLASWLRIAQGKAYSDATCKTYLDPASSVAAVGRVGKQKQHWKEIHKVKTRLKNVNKKFPYRVAISILNSPKWC